MSIFDGYRAEIDDMEFYHNGEESVGEQEIKKWKTKFACPVQKKKVIFDFEVLDTPYPKVDYKIIFKRVCCESFRKEMKTRLKEFKSTA